MTVSIPTYWGVLKTFENCARNSRKRVSLRGKILVKDMSNNRLPGPSILLRRASPNNPERNTDAAVVNHSLHHGSSTGRGQAGTPSPPSVPVNPTPTTNLFP